MEGCKYNKHLFLLNNTQKTIYKYYNNHPNKPACRKCGSKKDKDIIKLIHSNLSKSLNKVSQMTGELFVVRNECPKNKQWMCKKCQYYF